MKHSTGLKGSKAPGSTTVHRELRKIIKNSNSLDGFKNGLRKAMIRYLPGINVNHRNMYDN